MSEQEISTSETKVNLNEVQVENIGAIKALPDKYPKAFVYDSNTEVLRPDGSGESFLVVNPPKDTDPTTVLTKDGYATLMAAYELSIIS